MTDDQDQLIQVPSLGVAARFGAASLHGWWAMSGLLMESAATHARRASQLEGLGPYESLSTDKQAEHLACVISGVVLAAFALEAYANEVFLKPEHQGGGGPFDAAARQVIQDRWEPKIEWKPTLKKLAKALVLADSQHLFDDAYKNTSAVYQACDLALDLRNGFVHFKIRPLPSADPSKDAAASLNVAGQQYNPYKDLEDKLAACPFMVAPYRSDGTAPFPLQCFSYACVRWAITAHLKLADEFVTKMQKGVVSIEAPIARSLT